MIKQEKRRGGERGLIHDKWNGKRSLHSPLCTGGKGERMSERGWQNGWKERVGGDIGVRGETNTLDTRLFCYYRSSYFDTCPTIKLLYHLFWYLLYHQAPSQTFTSILILTVPPRSCTNIKMYSDTYCTTELLYKFLHLFWYLLYHQAPL